MESKEMWGRLESRLDGVERTLNGLLIVMERNTVSLEDHIKRTAALEKEMAPIKTHVALFGALAKLVGAAGGLVGLVVATLKLFGRI